MKKKTYIQPTIQVVEIGVTQLVCVSLDPSKTIDNENQFGSREFDYDDDEEW